MDSHPGRTLAADEPGPESLIAARGALNMIPSLAGWQPDATPGNFADAAGWLADRFNIQSVFDAGGGAGPIAAALRTRGVRVEAGHLPAQSALPAYDLVICFGVLPRLSEHEALSAIGAMTEAAPLMLVSVAQSVGEETGKASRQPFIWWLQRFAEAGFAPLVGYNPSVFPHETCLLERIAGRPALREIRNFAALVSLRLAADAARDAARDEARRAREAHARALAATLHDHDERVRELEERAAAAAFREAGMRVQLDAIRFSTTWRATRPLRRAIEAMPDSGRAKLVLFIRRAYRIVTGQSAADLRGPAHTQAVWHAPALAPAPLPVNDDTPAVPEPPRYKAQRVNPARFDPARENVILVVHVTSRTGAPILGWNIAGELAKICNIFTIFLNDGELTPDFEALSAETYGPFPPDERYDGDFEKRLQPLFANRRFRYAIINSSESRELVEVCARQKVTTLFLMHEFGTYVGPIVELRRAFDLATEIIFPAALVAQSSEEVHPVLKTRELRILPQGMSVVPAGKLKAKRPQAAQLQALAEARAAGAFTVIGAGTVDFRKGVDVFLAVAAAAKQASPRRKMQFIWVGHGYAPTQDMVYSVYLKEQMARSALQDCVTFLGEVGDLEPVYAISDAFLLSSRLDPLPNVSIDAAHRGIPIICFEGASGTAELLAKDEITAIGVVPHMDAQAAGRVIAHLAQDDAARQELSAAIKNLANETFSMARYVAKLDAIGASHALASNA